MTSAIIGLLVLQAGFLTIFIGIIGLASFAVRSNEASGSIGHQTPLGPPS